MQNAIYQWRNLPQQHPITKKSLMCLAQQTFNSLFKVFYYSAGTTATPTTVSVTKVSPSIAAPVASTTSTLTGSTATASSSASTWAALCAQDANATVTIAANTSISFFHFFFF